ncbi:MAG TPA: SIS domain-containing protein [Rhodothermales bacterium]
MNGSDKALNEYLAAFKSEDNALGNLLRNPDGREGIEHTPREIAQQPLLWRRTAKMMRELAPSLTTFLEDAGLFARRNRPTIVLTGAGTSDYVGQSVSDLVRERFNTPVVSFATTRITASPASFFAGDRERLMVHFARSGNSPESVAVLDIALEHHRDRIRHVVITCNADGRLAQRAAENADRVFLIVLDDACNDRGLAMTSSFSDMVIAAQALAHLDDMDGFVRLIDRIASAAEEFIRRHADDIESIADVDVFRRAFFLGNGDLMGAASEAALKVQELTAGRLIAKSDDTLAFRHGPVSAVNGHTLVGFFLSADPYTRRYEIDVLNQYRGAFAALGARTLVFTACASDVSANGDVILLTYDPDGQYDIPRLFQVNLAVLLGQMLALFASYKMGYNVDDPTADSGLYARTVQGVQIYDFDPEPDVPASSNR